MQDQDKSTAQLLQELQTLRHRLAAFERAAEAQRESQRRFQQAFELGPVGMVEDSTARQEAEESLQKEQRLLRRVLDMHERDRQLMAYEIHDGFVQLAIGAHLQLQAFCQLQFQDPAAAEKALATAEPLLAQSIAEARRLISGLRPPILDESGIVAAIEYLACEAKEQGGLAVEFYHRIRFDRLAAPLESTLFRVVQESLANVRRHSGSPRARIMLMQGHDWVRVAVEDWGNGFDATKVGQNHFGLQGIRERARLLGGRTSISSTPGKGTRIVVRLPLLESLCGRDALDAVPWGAAEMNKETPS
jgi:signal transduction histidine kinase